MKKPVKFVVLPLIIIALICTVLPYGGIVEKVTSRVKSQVIIIDPGHGGFDGGAGSNSGIFEKDINLNIGMKLREKLQNEGFMVIMTREDDIALSKKTSTIRNAKTKDLLARKELIEKVKPELTVSIHLNSFKEDRSVCGAQVFFPAGNTESERLAKLLQEELNEKSNWSKKREALIKKDVLIFRNTMYPIVIVECGFLSNQEEAELLQNPQYQEIISDCIFSGILNFLGKVKKNNIDVVKSN